MSEPPYVNPNAVEVRSRTIDETAEEPRNSSHPAEWVDRHGDALYRFAMLRVRDAHVAEEIVQETLVAALGVRRESPLRSAERTWLIGILKHKVADHFRRVSAGRDQDDTRSVDPVIEKTFSRKGLWRVAQSRWSGDPVARIESEEFWNVFRGCMAQLPAPMADAFGLHQIEQMNGQETCKVLGISSSNLWSLLHRARLRLRICLEVNWFKRKVRRDK